MRATPILFSLLSAALMSAGAATAHAAEGKYYDPSNAASQTGKTIGYELYRTIGCPGKGLLETACPVPMSADGDSDGDGVVDSKDKCPTTPAGRKVNADGCELDRDGDGIVDGVDKCPDLFAKTANGCPAVAPLTLEGVNFDNAQATLRPDAVVILDQVAASLKAWGNVKVEVGGHTDSRSSDAFNMTLSQNRAEAVRAYLISKGVAADRLTAKGYGESRPVADNATEEGRHKNRRVELVPQK